VRRQEFIAVLGGAVFAPPLSVHAEEKIPRVAVAADALADRTAELMGEPRGRQYFSYEVR